MVSLLCDAVQVQSLGWLVGNAQMVFGLWALEFSNKWHSNAVRGDALASATLLGPCFHLGLLKVVFKVIAHLRLFQPFNGYITSKRPLFYCVLWGLMGSIKQEPYESSCSPAIGSGKPLASAHTHSASPSTSSDSR